MPFAGTYTLAGILSKLQNKRGFPELEEALDYFSNSSIINQDHSKPVLLNSYEYFNLATQKESKSYIPLNKKEKEEKEEYIKNVLSKRKLEYEYEPHIKDLLQLIPAAYKRMNDKREEINFFSNTNVLIKLKEDFYI